MSKGWQGEGSLDHEPTGRSEGIEKSGGILWRIQACAPAASFLSFLEYAT